MPSTSTSKSHKQSKNNSSRDYSDFEEFDLKKNAVSGDKRKVLQNVKVLEEFVTPTKRRRDRKYGGSDEGEVVNVDELDLKLKRSEKRADRIHDGKYESGVVPKDVENESSKRGRERNISNRLGFSNSVSTLTAVNFSASDNLQSSFECPREDEMRNIELEKELEKRAKKREYYKDKDIKHKDTVNYKESGGRVSKSRDVKHQGESEKDNKHKNDKQREDCERDRNREVSYREDKYHEHSKRDYKHKEERYKEDVDRDHRHKTARTKDDSDRKKRSRDHASEIETENLKDVSHKQTNNRDGSRVYDDPVSRHKDSKEVSRHKDSKERRRDNDKGEITDYRSRSVKDPHSESKKATNDVKIERNSERGRSSSRNDDMEITDNHSRHSSPRNHSRHSSPPNDKYYPSRDHYRVSNEEDRGHQNVHSSRDVSNKIPSRSLEKISQKDDNCTDDLPVQKRPRSDMRPSTISPSSKSNEHRDLSRHDVRRNLDVKELGQQDFVSPSGFGSSENDRRKINNHNWRSGDHNMGIWSNGQGNWNNFPNWAPPLPIDGYIPFHHVPPPIFNPAMQQFRPSMFGRPPINMNYASMPYYLPPGRPPMNVNHAWETNNGLHGNWDHGTTQLNNQIWEPSADVQPAAQKNENSVQIPTDEILSGQTNQPIENEKSQPEINAPEVEKVTESSHVSIVEEDDATLISRAYLSKIDISKDLTRPDLYEQCRNILDPDQESASDESDCKILLLEDGLGGDISNGASLFEAVDDSVFKKAMSLYRKHKADFNAMNQEGVSNSTTSISEPDHEESRPVGDVKLSKEALERPDLEVSKENDDLPVQKLDTDPMNEDTVNDEQLPTSDKMEMEVDHPVANKEQESSAASVDGCEVKDSCNNDDNNKEGDKLSSDGDGSLLVLTNVSTSDLIECGSVNLSRIHHASPESTH